MLSYQLRHNSKHTKKGGSLSLKLRLILIINAVLLLILILGGVLAIDTAKKNVRAEVASAEKLALY